MVEVTCMGEVEDNKNNVIAYKSKKLRFNI